MEKINLKYIKIRPILKTDKDIITNFKTYEKDLKDFLVDDALSN
ncbi:MAG: hypothetical protein PHR26_01580 [Candidatus ainarchaeum sp.]|nr:hypothetical protein [Candidatus ainarchaeum sp.]MDD3975712.1 hypothetical protein [Candidatus ainarchaeum sp.]